MNWIQRLLQSRRMEKDLDTELRFHFESQVADKMQRGMTEAEARRSTRIEFGGLEQVKQECRESRKTLWLASIVQDLRFGMRILARSPGFSLTAILVLSLGIGVSSIAFSLYNLILLQSIPVREPATLVRIQRRSPSNIAPNVPYPSIAYYRDNAKSLSAVMASMIDAPIVLNGDELRISPGYVTSNYFSELGASAAVGRLFVPVREEASGAAPVVVLSYRLWQRKFKGDPAIVGKTIRFSGKPATVIGVTLQSFANLGTNTPDVWLPLAQHSYFIEGSKSPMDPAFDGAILMWGRLAATVSPAQAQQELLSLTSQLRKLYPTVIWDEERIEITPGAHFVSLDDGGPVVAFASLLVLLILAVACGNLGGLSMAHIAGRHREIQLRFDLGARPWRVIRQLLTENFLLGLLGSAAALPLCYVALRIALVVADAPDWMSPMPDWRVIAFTALMGILAALLFGMLPTLQLVGRKKKQAKWNQSVLNQTVVCAQVAASCVLLILAALLVRATFHALYADPGFDYEQVLSIDPGLGGHGYSPVQARVYFDQLESRLRTVPGVTSVSTALFPPLVANDVHIRGIRVDGRKIKTYPNWVLPDFFSTMGIPLLRGRNMHEGESNVVVLSASLARKLWPAEDAIGKRWNDGKETVIGVVGNTHAMELNNSDATEIYYPAKEDVLPGMSVLVKTSGDPSKFSAAIQSIAGSIDPRLYPTITPLKSGFRKSVAQVEQVSAIITLLGGIAIFLAVVGLLGLVAFAIAQRTKEIAIRLAVGASRAEIVSSILRRFVWAVLTGLIAGVAASAALSQVVRRGLYGISGLDPASYTGAIALLLAILAVAALLPIRRAFHFDIARILHSE